MIMEHNNKFIAYGNDGKILIISRDKRIVENYVNSKDRTDADNNGQRM